MSREQLEREYEALLAESKELAALRPLATEVVKLRADVAALTKSNRSLAASKESAASDFAYIQRQYSEASNAAVARANEATVAEAEASRLRGQLETGLVQHKMFFEGQVKSCKTEIGMLKGQIAILKREKERTEAAGVREKAALWDDHVAREAIKGKGEEESEEEEEVKDPSTLEDSLGGTSSQSLSQSQSQSQVFVCEWRNSPATVCGSTVKTREELQDHLVAAHIPPVSTISQG
ncbi:Chromo domain-like containing protein [Pseudohyphozyma bogoriensis]|nr:Chromo domain-like containing protein [Pseudohyphozyma bogoriensis]